jgi:hypothetical protein
MGRIFYLPVGSKTILGRKSPGFASKTNFENLFFFISFDKNLAFSQSLKVPLHYGKICSKLVHLKNKKYFTWLF